MSLLTENEVKKRLKDSETEIIIEKGTIITPSARELIDNKKMKIIIKGEEKNILDEKEEKNSFNPKFKHINGGYYDKKPEHLTQLFGDVLVPKNHKNIVFRGKIDSLESKVLELQILCQKNKKTKLLKDLEELLQVIRKILRAEVLNEELKVDTIIGLTEEEIHHMSHFPKKYFNIGHIFPDYKMGEYVVYLNSIRSQIRETEIVAYNTFIDETNEVKRPDIMKIINRLSSLVYVMMFKQLSGKY